MMMSYLWAHYVDNTHNVQTSLSKFRCTELSAQIWGESALVAFGLHYNKPTHWPMKDNILKKRKWRGGNASFNKSWFSVSVIAIEPLSLQKTCRAPSAGLEAELLVLQPFSLSFKRTINRFPRGNFRRTNCQKTNGPCFALSSWVVHRRQNQSRNELHQFVKYVYLLYSQSGENSNITSIGPGCVWTRSALETWSSGNKNK